jgi:hypothetical protein
MIDIPADLTLLSAELARNSEIPPSTARWAAAQGKFTAQKIGHTWLVSRREFRRYFATARVRAVVGTRSSKRGA